MVEPGCSKALVVNGPRRLHGAEHREQVSNTSVLSDVTGTDGIAWQAVAI